MNNYSEELKNPKWQRKRLEIFNRDDFMCQLCGDKETTLHVHHRYYYEKYKKPWEYENDVLVTLCENCHKEETNNRICCEQLLLKELKKKFFAEDLRQIAEGISEFNLFHVESVCASVISFFLSNEYLVQMANDEYFDWIIENNSKNKESHGREISRSNIGIGSLREVERNLLP